MERNDVISDPSTNTVFNLITFPHKNPLTMSPGRDYALVQIS